MPISITCQCGKKLKAPDTLAGKKVKCPACQHLLTVSESLEVIEDGIDCIDDTEGVHEEVAKPRSRAINLGTFKTLSTDVGVVYYGILLRVIAITSPLIVERFSSAEVLAINRSISTFLYPAGALLSMLGVFLSIIHTPATAPDAKLKAVFSFSFDIVSSYFFLASVIPGLPSFHGSFIQYISTCLAVLFYVLFLRNIGKIIKNRPLASRGVVLITSISTLMGLLCYETFSWWALSSYVASTDPADIEVGVALTGIIAVTKGAIATGIVAIICFFLYQRLLLNSQKILAKL